MNRTTRYLIAVVSIFILMSCSLFSSIFSSGPSQPPPPTDAPLETQPPQSGGELPAPTEPQVSAAPTETEAPAEPAAQPSSPAEGAALPQQVASGAIQLDGIRAVMEETTGEVLSIQVSNPGTEAITVTVPCGLVFEPVGGELQPLIVISEDVQSVAPGSSAELLPVVACADLNSGTPELDAGYQIGSFAQGDLFALADCMCQSDVDFDPESFEPVSAQFAIWTLSNGDLLSGAFDLADTPMASLLEDEGSSAEELQAAFAALQSMMVPMSQEWFDRCNLEFPTPQAP